MVVDQWGIRHLVVPFFLISVLPYFRTSVLLITLVSALRHFPLAQFWMFTTAETYCSLFSIEMWLRRSSPLSYLCRYLHHCCDRMDQVPRLKQSKMGWWNSISMQLLFSCKCETLLVITGNVSGYVFICTSCFFFSHSDWIWSEIYGDGALGSSVHSCTQN